MINQQSAMQNTIEFVNSLGDVIFRTGDGSYVLAQQIDAKPLSATQVLDGALDTIGIEAATDPATGATYEFFIAAYGLSRDAAFDGFV
ncbi:MULTISPECIES: hypothetical protein [Comamonas]|uniref:hypothetical protein n=1 Tax=Comamonas TaxID=283 RepID=UPI000A652D0B|nr:MULTISPECIES: hypothetical protein [Comamonas]QOQ81348.1 hypothetical protein INP81_18680 [Comamonas thiooxydans]